MTRHDIMDDEETDPHATNHGLRHALRPVEAPEKMRQGLLGDTDPLIGHGNRRMLGALFNDNGDAPATRAILDSILHEILDHLFQGCRWGMLSRGPGSPYEGALE